MSVWLICGQCVGQGVVVKNDAIKDCDRCNKRGYRVVSEDLETNDE